MGNCIGNLNVPLANRENRAIPDAPSNEGTAAEPHIEEPIAEPESASRAAFSIAENGRRVALFSDWETRKSLRTLDRTGLAAGTEAMSKLRIPLADIGRLEGALASLPAEVELTITGIDQHNQHALAAINLLPDNVKSTIRALDLSGSAMSDAGLANLTGLSHLKSLNLSGCRNFSAEGLAHLQGMTTLHALDLSRCYHLTRQGDNPPRFPVYLRTLNLSHCRAFTHNDFASLRPLTQLQSLNLSWCDNLTDEALEHVQFLTNLQSLNISACGQINGTGFAHLQPLTELRSLNLDSCLSITGVGFDSLQTMPKLQSLNLDFCRNLTDDGLIQLIGIAQLRELGVAGCPHISAWGLRHFRAAVAFYPF
jgi:hypothetical protein